MGWRGPGQAGAQGSGENIRRGGRRRDPRCATGHFELAGYRQRPSTGWTATWSPTGSCAGSSTGGVRGRCAGFLRPEPGPFERGWPAGAPATLGRCEGRVDVEDRVHVDWDEPRRLADQIIRYWRRWAFAVALGRKEFRLEHRVGMPGTGRLCPVHLVSPAGVLVTRGAAFDADLRGRPSDPVRPTRWLHRERKLRPMGTWPARTGA